MQIQKVDVLTLYDSLEVSFNSVDNTIILNIHNIDILQFIHHKAVSNDVYTKAEVDLTCSSLIGAAPAV